jgi:murein DD-endopeptidase MepM/ murein hydrolase activator NlpD
MIWYVKNRNTLVVGVTLLFTLSACLSDKPVNFANIKPTWEVRNAPVPVPFPRLKPASKAKKIPLKAIKKSKPPDGRPAGRTVTVQKGDTLYAISRITKIPVKTLIRANALKAPYNLNKGQVLKIPSMVQHRVLKGETLYAISRKYRVDVRTLARSNSLRAPFALTVGQNLSVSGASVKKIKASTSATKTAVSQRKAARQSRRANAIPAQQAKGFLWPVSGPLLSSFGAKPNGVHNDGINIKVGKGASIKSAESGVVAFVGDELGGWGNLVLIKHAGGWVTAYAHADHVLVKRGDVVRRGQVIAKAGSTGHVTSPQVHFELRRYKRAINPQRYLNKITG